MGILNIDEHVEEHRLMAIRYPSKAVIPGTNVIAVSTIPFLIMPGDGAANGCQFTGTNGIFTLSAAILANCRSALDGCYCYFSAGFGGSSLPAGWYYTEFFSDTDGVVYAETYTSDVPRRPAAKTPITPNLTGWVTATTNEITGPTGFILPGAALGKNGWLSMLLGYFGSSAGTKTYRVYANSVMIGSVGSTTSPISESLLGLNCKDSNNKKSMLRYSSSASAGIAAASASYAAAFNTDVDTSVDCTISITLQQSTNVATPVLVRSLITATYGE